MNHTLVMHVFDRINELVHEVSRFRFCQSLPPFDKLVNALVVAEFKENVTVVSILKEVLVFTNVSVLQGSMNFNLRLQLLH
jgi:hypothetical protein